MNVIKDPQTEIPLKTAVQQQVRQVHITSDQQQQLLSLQQQMLGSPKESLSIYRHKHWYAIVASMVVVVMLAWWQWIGVPTATNQLQQAIAQEVVKNHLKLKPLDLETTSIQGLQSFFTQLDFRVQASSLLQHTLEQPSDLLGGRYCSIQGVTAAQLRYQQRSEMNHSVSTLYQVTYDPTVYGEIPKLDQGQLPLSLWQQGLEVQLWVEKGLLMVLVSEPMHAF